MARPDVKDTRREQILDAFEACVARYGIEGATLAKVAVRADLARPLIRHNVGNRDALVAALVKRFTFRSRHVINELIAGLPERNRAQALIDCLLDLQYTDAQLVQVANALIAASADDRALARQMQEWLDVFIGQIHAILAGDYPDAPSDQVRAVAAGITGIYFNVEALTPLGDIKALAVASKIAAHLLVASLEGGIP